MPKGVIKDLISGRETSKPLFIPLIYCYAAKLAQIPIRNMLINPTVLTKCILMAQKLLGYDAVVFPFDPSLEAEALGASVEYLPNSPPKIRSFPFYNGDLIPESLDPVMQKGRMPVVFETTKRVKAQLGKQTDILAGVTGPLTLAFQLRGEAFREECLSDPDKALSFLEFTSQVTTRAIRNYGEIGVNGILLIENLLSNAGLEILARMKSSCTSISNTCNYYELPVILYVDGIPDQGRDQLFDLPWQGFIPYDPDHLGENAKELAGTGRCLGVPLTSEELENLSIHTLRERLKKYLDQGGNCRLLVSTAGDPSHNTPVENLHEIMRLLNQAH